VETGRSAAGADINRPASGRPEGRSGGPEALFGAQEQACKSNPS
jgi:hypothetical protein